MTDHEPTPFLPPTDTPRPAPIAVPATAPDRNAALEAAAALEEVLYEIKRVIVGQDAMLERVLVALLAGGHVLLEGVPGLAKTLTVKTLAQVLGGTLQPRPVHARPRPVRPRRHARLPARHRPFDTELGPVFGNFLLADEINRAPAKVQSALLEVMQEQQVTIGGETYPVPPPFLVLATQNPIESEGTYPLPEAQVDRFLLKILVDYPSVEDEAAVVARASAGAPEVRRVLDDGHLMRHRETVRAVAVDRDVIGLRRRARRRDAPPGGATGSATSRAASSSAPARAGRSASCRPPRRSRCCAAAATSPSRDVRDLAPDVLRHRLVLSYEALADGVTADDVLEPRPRGRRRPRAMRRRGAAA